MSEQAYGDRPRVDGRDKVSITGIKAAITIAVYQATGTRVRRLRIRIENLVTA